MIMGLPDDRMDIQCIVQAMEQYASAKREHDRAYEAYQGYSWGYHGAGYIDRMNEAAAEFGKHLDAYVELRVTVGIKVLLKELIERGMVTVNE